MPAPGEVLVLENLRFHPEEEKNDPEFAKSLAKLADLYVNDAFGTAHRAHASTAGILAYVEKGAAGLLMEKELQYLGKAVTNPERPCVAILGGAKVSDKIEVIVNLIGLVDKLLIGGAMAYTFLKAKDEPIGKSLVENDKVELAKELLVKAGDKLLLPVDHVVTASLSGDTLEGRSGHHHPRRQAGGGHRAGDHRAVQKIHRGRGHGHLEWTDGSVREAAVR